MKFYGCIAIVSLYSKSAVCAVWDPNQIYQSPLANTATVLSAVSAEQVVPSDGSTEGMPLNVADYADTIREGGLEGSVGDVPFNTPNKLQDKIFEILTTVRSRAKTGKSTIEEALERAKPHIITQKALTGLEQTVPLVAYVRKLLSEACPEANGAFASHTGDTTIPSAFPTCLLNHMVSLTEAAKKDLGQRIRNLLYDKQQTELLFPDPVKKSSSQSNFAPGLCQGVAAFFDLPDDYCQSVHDILISAIEFVRISTLVQEHEQEHYGTIAAMIELDATVDMNRKKGRKKDKQPKERVLFAETFLDSGVPRRQLLSLKWKNPLLRHFLESDEDSTTNAPAPTSIDTSPEDSTDTSLNRNDVRDDANWDEKDSSDSQKAPRHHGTLHASSRRTAVAKLKAQLLFRRTWQTLCIVPTKAEADHLVQVWYNDPIHKWRYTIGIIQWTSIMGIWLADFSSAA